MRKLKIGLVVLGILMLFCSLAVPPADTRKASADGVVTFPDSNLEAVIRDAISKPSGDIYQSDLAGLTTLNGSNRDINNLTGLEYCSNIQFLYLYMNNINNISALSSLTSLQHLGLRFNQISDISPLSSLTNLQGLEINDNQISDISPLSSLTNLRGLGAWHNQISNISALAGLSNLERLGIRYNQISDISALSGLTNLQYLGLDGNQISNISAISGLTKLVGLALAENNISDITPLAGLTNLGELWLNDSQISDISPLSGLTNLSYLSLFNNHISDISVLSGLTKLIDLYLGANQISDISALSGLTNLQNLDLRNNQINGVSALSSLTNLQTLVLLNNEVSDISPLSGLTNLWGLGLGNNHISDISALAGLNNLQLLYVFGNQVSDIKPLVDNSGLSTGDTIYLNNSPLSATSINTYIPQLQARGVTVHYDASSPTPTPTNDQSNPTINIDFPLDGQTFNSGTVTVRGWASDNVGVSKIEVRVNNGSWQQAFGTTSWAIQVTLNHISNTIDVRAINTSGEMTAKSITVNYNTPSASPTSIPTPTPTVSIPWLYEVHGNSATNIFAVGDAGTILHYDGKSWEPMDSGTSSTLWSVWVSPEDSAFAVGNAGLILQYDGDSWKTMVSGTIWTLAGVWGSSSNDVFAVGDNGLILHYDGISWSQLRTSTGQFIHGVWCTSSNDVYAAGWDKSTQKGLLLHYDGTSWNQIDIGDRPALNRLWGSSPTDLFVAGTSGAVVHYDGTSWSEMTSGSTQNIHGIWGDSANNVYAVSWADHSGAILHYDGKTWQNVDIPDSTALSGIWGSAANDIWAVGYDSKTIHYSGVYHTDFQDSVPLVEQISTEPEVIGTNVVLALALVLLFYLAATLFNSTFRENYEDIGNWFRHILKLPAKNDEKSKAKNKSREYLVGAVTVLATALIYCFIEPYFTHGLTFLALFLSLLVAIGIVTFFYDGIQTLLFKYGSSVPAAFRIRPIAIVIAIVFVIISRLFHFHPGLTFGFVGACVPFALKKEPSNYQRAMPILLSALFIAAISAAAFGLRMPVHDALAGGNNFGLALLEMTLVAVFILGLEGLVFTLLPLAFVDGYWILKWKWWLWFIVSTIVVFLFFHIIINQDGEIVEAASESNIIMMGTLTGISLLLGISTWLFFLIRKNRGNKKRPHSD